VAPLLLRVVLGIVLLYWAYETFKNSESSLYQKIIGGIEGVAGLLLVIGMQIQIVAMVVTIDLLIKIVEKIMKKAFLTNGINYYLLVLAITLSLIVTGAGIWAIDIAI
jgi:uncharacterized membrane protein YphA (DoxX/SURF4 family)